MQPNIESRTVFFGDNLDFLRGINSECVDLIYADPPFNKKKEFVAPIGSAAEGAGFLDYFTEEDIKDEWVEELRSENFELHSFLTGIRGVGNSYNYCYLVYMSIRLLECHRILKPTGSMYLHCDQTMNWGLRAVLDIIFGDGVNGKPGFRNEIVWSYRKMPNNAKHFQKNHDTLLFYAKGKKHCFNRQYEAYAKSSAATYANAKKVGYNANLKKKMVTVFDWKKYHSAVENKMLPDDLKPVEFKGLGSPLRAVWEMPIIAPSAKERTGWPTQKPLKLLERIIKASSNKGDLVLDPFCGCATTCIAAERLQRNWAGIDVAVEAWNQIQRRLVDQVPADLMRGKPTLTRTPPVRGQEDTRPKKYVYVVSNPAYPGMYKVGVATNAEARLNSYQTADPKRAYKLEFKILTAEYKTLEPYIHRKFNAHGEWVPGKLSEIIAAMKQYQSQQKQAVGLAASKVANQKTHQR